MSDARECVGCGDFVYPPEEVCKECAYILELEDTVDRLRVRLESIAEIAEGPVNEFETPLRRLDMILRLARKGTD